MCGDCQILWNRLFFVVKKVEKEVQSGRIFTRKRAGGGFESLSRLKEKKRRNLFEALNLSITSKSSEPRDKVFGLLGLVTDATDFVAIPNYSQSLEQVHLSMMLTYIAATARLDPIALLAVVSAKDPDQLDLPSWVPNWHDLNHEDISARFDYLVVESRGYEPFDRGDPAVTYRGKYRAAEDEFLNYSGIEIGHIMERSGSLFEETEPSSQNRETLLPNPYSKGGDSASGTSHAILFNFYSTSYLISEKTRKWPTFPFLND